MTICKRKAAGPVAVVRRPIPPKILGEEVHQEISIVDGVRMFIEEYKRLRRRWLDDLRILSIGVKLAVDEGRVPTGTSARCRAIVNPPG